MSFPHRLRIGALLLALGIVTFGHSPRTESQPGPQPAPVIRPAPLPADFGRKYGSILDLVEELSARQKAYVEATSPEEKARHASVIKVLIERIIAAANELKEDLRTNRYVSVPGFTVGIGLPPTFNFDLDFEFK